MHVVASKCSRSRFLSDKYKTVQSFRPHFLQNSPRVQLHTSAGDCKVVGNISGSQCESLFKSSIAFLIMLVTSQSSVASMPISVEGTRKNRLQPGQESIVHAPVLSYCSLLRKPQPKPTGVQEHCREGETKCWLSIFRGVSFWSHHWVDVRCQCTLLYLLFWFQEWTHSGQCPGCYKFLLFIYQWIYLYKIKAYTSEFWQLFDSTETPHHCYVTGWLTGTWHI